MQFSILGAVRCCGLNATLEPNLETLGAVRWGHEILKKAMAYDERLVPNDELLHGPQQQHAVRFQSFSARNRNFRQPWTDILVRLWFLTTQTWPELAGHVCQIFTVCVCATEIVQPFAGHVKFRVVRHLFLCANCGPDEAHSNPKRPNAQRLRATNRADPPKNGSFASCSSVLAVSATFFVYRRPPCRR